MKYYSAILPILFSFGAILPQESLSQTFLKADGKTGSTYQLINTVLGGGKESEETPDCAHPKFGPHITQIQDEKENVFAFYLHVTPDNDRCNGLTDRQRNEIKVFGPSPPELKGFQGETVTYSWKFKLPKGFQASSSFTHIHQIKAVDGDDGSPIMTLTPRYNSKTKNQTLQVIHVGRTGSADSKAKVLKEVDLSPFLGQWVKVTEQLTYAEKGKYSVKIKGEKDKKNLLSFSNGNIDLWRDGTTFVRPKWGIYRSLNDKQRLRDEVLLFNNFCLGKGNKKCT